MRMPEPKPKNNKFLVMKDGETIRGVFLGEVAEFYIKWKAGKSTPSTPDDPDAIVKYKCNIAVPTQEGGLVVKIWEFSGASYEQLYAINKNYPIGTIKVEITRKGSGLKTKYIIMPLVAPKDLLTEIHMDMIRNLKLLPLDRKIEEAETEWPAHDEHAEHEEIPF